LPQGNTAVICGNLPVAINLKSCALEFFYAAFQQYLVLKTTAAQCHALESRYLLNLYSHSGKSIGYALMERCGNVRFAFFRVQIGNNGPDHGGNVDNMRFFVILQDSERVGRTGYL